MTCLLRIARLLIGGLLALLVAGSTGATAGVPAATTAPLASARSYAVTVIVPNAAGAGTTEAAAPPDALEFADGFVFPDDGSIVATGAVTATSSAVASAQSVASTASSEVSGVRLFGGEVTVNQATAVATVSGKAGEKARGNLSKSLVVGLTVLGQPAAVTPGTVQLGDWGYANVLVQNATAEGVSFRGTVTAVDVHLTADHGGLPAGSQIQIGYAEAAARPGPALPATTTGETTSTTQTTEPATTTFANRPAEAPTKARTRKPPPLVRRPLPSVEPKLTKGGYVFPVHGPASFGDTFGAARANVGWHHGEDIFAPMGAPVLAVADGTLFSVGWNDIGGNRFWLRDEKGNEFYYAHLSAYSPLAVNGTRVRAGDVIGFVGNTGDAETTPPHLHFEIHPFGLLDLGYDGVIAPYKYLIGWQRLEDVRFVAGAAWVPSLAQAGASTAPSPGAYLLSSADISTTSGLEPGSLKRAMERESRAVSAEAALPQTAGRLPGPPRTNVGLNGG